MKQKRYYDCSFTNFEELEQTVTTYIYYDKQHRIKAKSAGMSPVQYRIHTSQTVTYSTYNLPSAHQTAMKAACPTSLTPHLSIAIKGKKDSPCCGAFTPKYSAAVAATSDIVSLSPTFTPANPLR